MVKDEITFDLKYEAIVREKVLELFKDTSARIFLFGSRARGDQKGNSDFDVGVESVDYETFKSRKLKFDEFWEESIVPHKVDLVYFDDLKPEFKQAAKQDIILWKND